MDSTKIAASLIDLFNQGSRIVFWQDVDAGFRDLIPDLVLDDVTVVLLDEVPALQVKVLLELDQPKHRFLLYATGEVPNPEQDWLLDVRFYAESFAADRVSMILKELGLDQQRLREHVALRSSFLASKDRLQRLRRLVKSDDDEDLLDRKMMAVLLRIDQAEFFSLVLALFASLPGDDPESGSAQWDLFQKHGLVDVFWRMVEDRFGYADDSPSLPHLLIRLMVTDFSHALGCAVPDRLAHFCLPAEGEANVVVCLGQWRDSASRSLSHDALSGWVAERIKLLEQLIPIALDDLFAVKTFLLVEKVIANQLRNRILETREILQLDDVGDLVSHRRGGYWANRAGVASSDAADAPRDPLWSVYTALLAAAELFDLKNRLGSDFCYASPAAFYAAYCSELYRFDQLYRQFCEAADQVEAKDWDVLKELRDEVEQLYGTAFLANLALKWGDVLEQGLLASWQLEGVPNQQHFFEQRVRPFLDKGEDRRVFVIISDAFRYECAEELTQQLNCQYRFSATLTSQLGVLPSYTPLGMAALLPHKTLSYTDAGKVLVDGRSVEGLDNRQKILDSVQGVAVKAEAFMAMKKEAGRAFIKPYRVVYIYHNQVDAIGDSAATEDHTFAAVRTAIQEIGNLANKVVNSLNGTYLLVTADHGFLFQENPPGLTEKNILDEKPPGTLLAKKRYIVGHNFTSHPMAYLGSTAITANCSSAVDFWIPKGINRFHFVSGARFVHGGAMLQEIVVPVITVQQKKGKQAALTRIRQVGISVLGHSFKITSNRYKVRFIQTEAVSTRVKPLTVKVAIYDGADPVTNLESVTFDSSSKDMNEWRREVWLTLASRPFSNKTFYLILRNAETEVEEVRLEVTIDLAFSNDF